ncbi:MAG: MoxR family ATPase [Solirubrobacteraceae bacterium]|nr:MoxR family ATPase [Solirubrobacteraceae bacterium]
MDRTALAADLARAGYLADDRTVLVSALATELGKPVLVEGPAGVGKTELAKALAKVTGRELVRLQCYEGLDEARALYEWNYRAQLLRIQAAHGSDGDWGGLRDDLFAEEFLLERPLLQAIRSEQPVVLLVDEIDKADQEFEALLLELLSDFQVSIPELGTVHAESHPLVILTSNAARELTEALKRRCLFLTLDYPSPERERDILLEHVPGLPDGIALRIAEVAQKIRDLDLRKPPAISETIDWAHTLLLIGATQIDQAVLRETLPVVLKHRTDLDLVAERAGVVLGQTASAGRAGSR